jgi:hypothetical protein
VHGIEVGSEEQIKRERRKSGVKEAQEKNGGLNTSNRGTMYAAISLHAAVDIYM